METPSPSVILENAIPSLLFTAGKLHYGIDCQYIQEIIFHTETETSFFNYKTLNLPLVNSFDYLSIPKENSSFIVVLKINHLLFGLLIPEPQTIESISSTAIRFIDPLEIIQKLHLSDLLIPIPPPNPIDSESSNLTSLTITRMNDRFFGFRSEEIEEIGDLGEFTPFPQKTTSLFGFKNLKGTIIPLLLFKKIVPTLHPFSKLIVIPSPSGKYGLIADEIHTIISIPSSLLTEDPCLIKIGSEMVEVSSLLTTTGAIAS